MPSKSTADDAWFCDTAVYWPPPENDGYGGRAYGAPVQLSCRWNHKDAQIKTASGEERSVSAQVRSASNLESGGYLWEGDLANLSVGERLNPLSKAGTLEIIESRYWSNIAQTRWLGLALAG